MSDRNQKLQELFVEKKYSEIINLIENIDTKNRPVGLINLLGVCKLLRDDEEYDDLMSAHALFKQCYLKEKETLNGLDSLINFINTVAKIFDRKIGLVEEKIISRYIDEAEIFFKEAEIFFNFNEKLVLSIIRIYKRQNNLNKTLFYLKKLIDNNFINPKILCSYIYRNCFINNWNQEKFFSYSNLLNKNLIQYSEQTLFKINYAKDNKINLGFLSSDIKNNHSITYFLKTVLLNYNKSKFKIFLVFNSEENDETSEYFKSLVDECINIHNLSDPEAINIIRKNNIAIMIDLMGVTSSNRLALFKNRLAPIQITWLGYCNTTGVDQMDFLIADPNLIKKDEQNLYSEKIIYLPSIWNSHSAFSFERINSPPPLLKNNYITFGSFNNFNKINEEVVRVWSKILKNILGSKLILKSSISMQVNILKDLFNKHNVLDSIIFSEKKPFNEHLNLYHSIDISLDTFPYNGVTTSFEAIWMGVPVLTMKGYNFNSRCGESINKNLKMDYMIAENEEQYFLKAKKFSDINQLINLRNDLFEKVPNSPLFDVENFSREFFGSLENIYKNI